jgi:hypothetical protein
MFDDIPVSLQGTVWRHYKEGKMYTVIGTAWHTETGKMLVLYTPQYPPFGIVYARPAELFFGCVDDTQVRRFTQVKQDL